MPLKLCFYSNIFLRVSDELFCLLGPTVLYGSTCQSWNANVMIEILIWEALVGHWNSPARTSLFPVLISNLTIPESAMKVAQLCPTLWPHGLYRRWNSPGQNTGVGSRSLLQGIFPNQEWNPGLLHCRWILYQLSHSSVQWLSRVQLCNPMGCSTLGFPVHHQLQELAQTNVYQVGDANQPTHPLSFSSSLLLMPSVFPSIRVFSNELALCIRWPKYWSFSFSNSPSNEYSGLISFRMNWFDLLAVQGTLKSLLQHHTSKPSILRHSTFFMVQLSHPYITIGKTIALTRWTFVGKVITSLLSNMLSRLVISFLLRNKRLLILWLQSLSAVILKPKKIKSVTVSIVSLSSLPWSLGSDAMIFIFWMLSFKPTLSLLSGGFSVPLHFLP